MTPAGSSAAVPKAPAIPQIEEPPQWARQLLVGFENLNSRLGLIESGAIRPSFAKATSSNVIRQPAPQGPRSNDPDINDGASELSEGGAPIVIPPAPVAPAQWQQVQRPKAPKGPAAPKMGESGSGYTQLPNGKMVRNKRPAHKPLPVRQAINWRGNATTELVSFLKEKGIGKSDPKPVRDPLYQTLVYNLALAKAYHAYTKNGGTDQVQVWREANKDATALPQLEESQSWADEVNSSVASQGPEATVVASEIPISEQNARWGITPDSQSSWEVHNKVMGRYAREALPVVDQTDGASEDAHAINMARVQTLKAKLANRSTVFPGARSVVAPEEQPN